MKKQFNTLSSEEKRVLQTIQHTYMQIYEGYKNQENESKTIKMIFDLGIKKIQFKKGLFKKKAICYLELNRPGYIIGKRGEMIKRIEENLEKEFHYPIKLKVYDSSIDQWLIPISIFDDNF